jgi:hypothetical protein
MEKGERIMGRMIVYLQTGGNISILQYEAIYTGINIATELYGFPACAGAKQRQPLTAPG